MCCKRLLYDVAMSLAFHNIMMLLLFLMNFRWRSFSKCSRGVCVCSWPVAVGVCMCASASVNTSAIYKHYYVGVDRTFFFFSLPLLAPPAQFAGAGLKKNVSLSRVDHTSKE